VRHGADPRTALAVVLGVAAEDIRVRERETASCDKDRACGEPGGINYE
jgi:hypothetical protein